jgi:hypothetical protein
VNRRPDLFRARPQPRISTSSEGISSVVSAVNRKRIEEVYDPAI